MPSPIPIDTMTMEEKLQAMEMLWDDLCQRAELMPSPGWHQQVLQDREAALEQGMEEIEDWEDAKRTIRNEGQ